MSTALRSPDVAAAVRRRWLHILPAAGRCLGAQVSGVDVRSPLPPQLLVELRKALLKYRVLAFSPECTGTRAGGGAIMTEDQLVAFFAQFATPLRQDGREASAGERRPEVFWVTNIHPTGSVLPESPFLSDSELQLHSDLSYRAQPGSRQGPPASGEAGSWSPRPRTRGPNAHPSPRAVRGYRKRHKSRIPPAHATGRVLPGWGAASPAAPIP